MQRIFSYIALLSIIISIAVAQCPNACSGHGYCNPNTRVCQCYNNYMGNDCSVFTQELPANIEFRGNVGFRAWSYFKFVSTGSMFRVIMQHPVGQDADIYIRKNDIPDLMHFDYFDVSISDRVVVEVPATGEATTFYIGIHGYSATNFTLKVETRTTNCPNDCSRHGRCNANNQCICDAGYGGDDCSVAVQEVTLGQWSSQLPMEERQWLFYHVRITQNMNFLRIEAIMTSGDVDIFVLRGRTPTLELWDYLSAGIGENETLNISTPPPGEYYIGFYAFKQSNFRFRVLAGTQQCPNRCSNHGTCEGTTCRCAADYTGPTCDTLNRDMRRGETLSGHVDSNEWNYYQYTANTDTSFTVTLMHDTSNRADCDLYINSGSKPTRFQFQYRNIAPDPVTYIRVDTPGTTRWYIGIYGYSTCTYNITVTQSSECQGCVHGRCINGQCVCDNGWAGANCDIAANNLVLGTVTSGSLTTNQWRYYVYTGESSAFHVILTETQDIGSGLWLFVRIGGFPSLTVYDFSDTSLNTKTHKIDITWPQSRRVTYYIGVYGSPYVIPNIPASYNLVAWAPPF